MQPNWNGVVPNGGNVVVATGVVTNGAVANGVVNGVANVVANGIVGNGGNSGSNGGGNGGGVTGNNNRRDILPRGPRSWVWKHVHKIQRYNSIGVMRDYVVCQVNQCGHETLFCGTHAIANHLTNEHDLLEPKTTQQDLDQTDDAPNVRERRANAYLLNFVATSYLPFNIVDNRHFQRYI